MSAQSLASVFHNERHEMTYYIEFLSLWFANDAVVNALFAVLVLWAGFGRQMRFCALATAVLHFAVAFL